MNRSIPHGDRKKLTEKPEKQNVTPSSYIRSKLPSHGISIVLAMIILSLLLHVTSYLNLDYFFGDAARALFVSRKTPPVKITIVEKPPRPLTEAEKQQERDRQKILETPQTKTEKPKHATHVGQQDHATDKETKLAPNAPRPKGADPGQKGNPKAVTSIPDKIRRQSNEQPKARTGYEALLPMAQNDIPGTLNGGYQDYLDEDLAIGDRIDMNTTEFRYIGYFTGLRKAIELVWVYPGDAIRRGMQGVVSLEFVIAKNGKASHVKVLRSSGYEILDRYAIQAVEQASPFAPLPDGFGKERIIVTGAFQYVLNGFYRGSH